MGQTYTVEDFAKLIEEKQKTHSSIDLITPTHFSKQLQLAFEKINKAVPVIWNSSGYEKVSEIKKVVNFVDIFLVDFKYSDNTIALKHSKCKDYKETALKATSAMCKLKEDVEENGILKQGVIIRHLVLPDYIENSLGVLDLINENFKGHKVSIMSQFTPNGKSTLKRKITPLEYKIVLKKMQELDITNGYIQAYESANSCFTPDF